MSHRVFRGIATPFARLREQVPFDAPNVAEAPATAGVYFLYSGHRMIYIGVAANGATIQERLECHLRGDDSTCTERATGFACEPARDPLPLYWAYMNVYRGGVGGLLPDCNLDTEWP
jgi:hypothetical protein